MNSFSWYSDKIRIIRIIGLMKKYWTIFKLELQREMQYRFNFFISIFSNGFILIFFFYFWIKIYSEGNKIGSYDLKALLTYYLLVTIWTFLFFRDLGWIISDEIREGSVNNFLLKPLSYIFNHLAKYFGGFVNGLVNYIPILIIFFIFLRRFLVYPNNLIQLLFFLLSSILAAALYFLISYNLGLTSFWLGMIQSLVYGSQIIGDFLGGKYIPIDLFPNWLLRISNFLPFRYMIYEPVSIFLNKVKFSWQSLIVPVVWIAILSIIACVLWKRGIKIYEAYGA